MAKINGSTTPRGEDSINELMSRRRLMVDRLPFSAFHLGSDPCHPRGACSGVWYTGMVANVVLSLSGYRLVTA
eukprot:6213747-Pleurochrysis_carterae.AAC.1